MLTDRYAQVCGLSAGYCRQVPDISLDTDPASGYPIYCTTADCGSAGWLPIGGTSAAAPLIPLPDIRGDPGCVPRRDHGYERSDRRHPRPLPGDDGL